MDICGLFVLCCLSYILDKSHNSVHHHFLSPTLLSLLRFFIFLFFLCFVTLSLFHATQVLAMLLLHFAGADFGLPEPMDAPRDIPAESNLQRTSPAFQNAGARISPSSESAGPPITSAAGRLSNPGEPSSSGKEFLYRDDSFAQETDAAPSGQLTITYDHTTTARTNSNVAEDNSQGTDTRAHDNDMHLDLAQASAQDALTTATSALAQSHMVWARLHSQNHSEEGLARDARIASVAATVAAASSVAKAAVEAARAIAEVSVDAFIQAGGYQVGDTSLAQLGSTRLRPLQVFCDVITLF
jgi:hypothetical protein